MVQFAIFLAMAEHWLMPWCGLLAGFFGILAIDSMQQEKQFRGEAYAYSAFVGLAGLVLWFFLPQITAMAGHRLERPIWHAVLWPVFALVGVAAAVHFFRNGVQFIDRLKERLTKKTPLSRDTRTDVRSVAAVLPSGEADYNPRDYYKAGLFFMGLAETGEPQYWQGRLPHVSIVGTSGGGKGRKLQDLAAQSVANGEALIYLDPKDDEWGPHALADACNRAGVAYHFVRLLPESPPQLNLIAGAKAWEIEELFTASFDLGDKGKGSDFFKAKDRNAAAFAAQQAAEHGLTFADLYAQMSAEKFWQDEAPGFLGKLREMAGVAAINAATGVSLAHLVRDGGGLYVVGSMTLQAVKRAQQMLFVRIQQLCTARDRLDGPQRTVMVVADEAKYHISRPILQGLGASRDKGMRVVLAYQSFEDLKDCSEDLSPEAVKGAFVENTSCKLVYRVDDPDTADWLARKSGVTLVDDETRQVTKNIALSETAEQTRTIRQTESYLFDTNKIQSLPKGWAILFGNGLASLCHVAAYPCEKSRAAVTPIAAVSPEPEPVGVPAATVADAAPAVGRKKRGKRSTEDIFNLEDES